MTQFEPFSYEQSRHLKEVRQTTAQFVPLASRKRQLVGGMQWKTISGKEYLYRYSPDPVTGRKRSTSLGRRSPETEQAYETFLAERAAVTEEYDRLAPVMETQRRVSAALRLGDLRKTDFAVLSALADAGVMTLAPLSRGMAIRAYQVEAGQFADVPLPDGIVLSVATEQLEELVDLVDRTLRAQDLGYGFDMDRLAFRADQAPWVHIRPHTPLVSQLERLDVGDDVVEQFSDLLLAEVPSLLFSRSGHALPISAVDPRALAMSLVLDSIDVTTEDRFDLLELAEVCTEFADLMKLEFEPGLLDFLAEYGDIRLSEDSGRYRI
jgi:hypothetical protein